MLGRIVEKVSGQSYADYVSQRILEPLRMEHATASREHGNPGGKERRHDARHRSR